MPNYRSKWRSEDKTATNRQTRIHTKKNFNSRKSNKLIIATDEISVTRQINLLGTQVLWEETNR